VSRRSASQSRNQPARITINEVVNLFNVNRRETKELLGIRKLEVLMIQRVNAREKFRKILMPQFLRISEVLRTHAGKNTAAEAG